MLSPRDRILSTAARLFQIQGYHATGLNQIVKESEAPKGSLYHYFPGGKEELAVAALARSRRFITDRLENNLAKSDNAIQALQGLVQSFAAALDGSDFTAGLSVANLALDTAHSSEAIRQACSEAYDEWIVLLREKLLADGHSADRASESALLLHAWIEGAFIHAIVHRDTAIFRLIAQRIPVLLA